VAIFTLIPAVSAIAGFVILGQIVSSRIVVALIIGALGALWVIFRADIQLLSTFSIGRGELIFFVGCIAHAIMPILFRLLNRGENPLMVTFGLLISGAIILCIIGAREIIETDWIGLPTIVWVVIFYVSICASAMTFVLLQFASMHLPATNVMAYTYLTPIWVLVWELFLGHSVPPLWVLGGVFLAVVSVTLLLKTSLDN
jgi:drug/metabolite transporter (DMT)-like permease